MIFLISKIPKALPPYLEPPNPNESVQTELLLDVACSLLDTDMRKVQLGLGSEGEQRNSHG